MSLDTYTMKLQGQPWPHVKVHACENPECHFYKVEGEALPLGAWFRSNVKCEGLCINVKHDHVEHMGIDGSVMHSLAGPSELTLDFNWDYEIVCFELVQVQTASGHKISGRFCKRCAGAIKLVTIST